MAKKVDNPEIRWFGKIVSVFQLVASIVAIALLIIGIRTLKQEKYLRETSEHTEPIKDINKQVKEVNAELSVFSDHLSEINKETARAAEKLKDVYADFPRRIWKTEEALKSDIKIPGVYLFTETDLKPVDWDHELILNENEEQDVEVLLLNAGDFPTTDLIIRVVLDMHSIFNERLFSCDITEAGFPDFLTFEMKEALAPEERDVKSIQDFYNIKVSGYLLPKTKTWFTINVKRISPTNLTPPFDWLYNTSYVHGVVRIRVLDPKSGSSAFASFPISGPPPKASTE